MTKTKKIIQLRSERICVCRKCFARYNLISMLDPCPECGSTSVLITTADKHNGTVAGQQRGANLMDLGLRLKTVDK